MPLAAASAAPIALPTKPLAPAVPAVPRQRSIEERVEELAVYAESGDPVGEGDIWHVPESAEIFGADGFTFRDFLDIINPLQHIPVVSTLYRAATDDTLDPGARLLGGALFGGIGGLAAAVVNALVEEETGADIGANILASLTGDGDATAATAWAPLPPAPTKEAAGALPDPASPAAADRVAGVASAGPVSIGGAPADASRARTPISLLPRSAPEAPESAALAGKAMAVAPPDAVPRLMQDALDKYEALNRGRPGQAIAEEI